MYNKYPVHCVFHLEFVYTVYLYIGIFVYRVEYIMFIILYQITINPCIK